METSLTPKRRPFFDTGMRPEHVSFDDGCAHVRVFPWSTFLWAHWAYADVDTMELRFGDWAVVLIGRNLAPLREAIQQRTLHGIRARPEFDDEPGHDGDVYATRIIFGDPHGTLPPMPAGSPVTSPDP